MRESGSNSAVMLILSTIGTASPLTVVLKRADAVLETRAGAKAVVVLVEARSTQAANANSSPLLVTWSSPMFLVYNFDWYGR
jgi:hypothetical protein